MSKFEEAPRPIAEIEEDIQGQKAFSKKVEGEYAEGMEAAIDAVKKRGTLGGRVKEALQVGMRKADVLGNILVKTGVAGEGFHQTSSERKVAGGTFDAEQASALLDKMSKKIKGLEAELAAAKKAAEQGNIKKAA